MYDLAASYINGHMVDIIPAGIEQQVAGLHLAGRNRPSLGRLVSGASSRADPEMGVHAHDKAGAVRAACEAGAAVDIGVA